MALSPFGKYFSSLKFDARGSGVGVATGPVYGNGTWVAIRANHKVITSTDGVNWTASPYDNDPSSYIANAGSGNIQLLKFLNGQFVYVVNTQVTGNNYPRQHIFTSTDGLTWTHYFSQYTNPNNITTGTIVVGGDIVDIEYANSTYWAVSSTGTTGNRSAKIYSSGDLQSWSTAFTGSRVYAFSEYYLTSIVRSGSNLTASGYFTIAGDSGNYPYVVTSSNGGVSWTYPSAESPSVYNGAPDHKILSIATNGSVSMAVGAGFVYTNASGTWTTKTSPNNSMIFFAVAWVNSTWIMYGIKNVNSPYEYAIYTSTNNGTSWTSRTVPSTSGLVNAQIPSVYSTKPTLAIGVNGNQAIGFNFTTTDSQTFSFVNYRIPNQQPYLDYGQKDSYGTWRTIDFWVWIGNQTSAYTQYPIVSQYYNDTNYWWLFLETQGQGRSPYLRLGTSASGLGTLSNGGSGLVESSVTSLSGTIIPGQWNHIRIVRNTGVGAIYINGVKDIRTDFGDTFTAPAGTFPSQGNLTIGRIGDGNESLLARDVDYWIDEFMMNSNPLNSPSAPTIPVPTERYFSTDTTLLLLHFNNNYLDDTSKPITADSPLATTASLTAQATRVVRTTAALSSTASLTATSTRARLAQANLSAFATEVIITARTRGIASDMASTATLQATAKKLNGTTVALSSTAQVSATAKKLNGTTVALSSTAQVSAQVLRIKGTSVNLQVTGIELAAVVKIAQGYCQAFDANFTLANQPVKTARTSAQLTSTAQVTCLAQKVKYGQASLTVEADMEANIGKTKEMSASLSATATLNATAIKTTRINLDLQVQADLVTNILRTRGMSAHLEAFDTQVTIGKRTRTVQAQMSTQAELFVSTGNIVRAEINMQVGAFELVQGAVIRYDPYYKIRIKPETRLLHIHEETRFITIKPETRVNIIKDQI